MSDEKDKKPDEVTHRSTSSLPFGLGPPIYITTVHKDEDTYTGYGWTKEKADEKAGEKYSEGKKDKK